MDDLVYAQVSSGDGQTLRLTLLPEGDRHVGSIVIDGVWYHLERIKGRQLVCDYKVDLDEGYQPQTDGAGYAYIIAPFSR